jgi:hypothetical protein
MMSNKEIFLDVDDYLDLYLLAGKLNAPLWQKEIKEKLQHLQYDSTLTLRNIWQKYKKVNMEIIVLYQQYQKQPFNNEKLLKKIWDLKQQRMELSRQIQMEEGKLQRHKP